MKFQGSGFAVTVPERTLDASAYTFVLADLGGFPPNLTVRFEAAEDLNLEQRVAAVLDDYRSALENLTVIGSVPVRARGEWRYATHVVEWGGASSRIRQKQLFLWVPNPAPTLYVLTGTDLAEDFSRSEPVFDEIIRSFEPNGVNALR